MNDGGPAYPCGVEADYYGMSLREAFAVAIVTGRGGFSPTWVLDEAQKLTDEAVKRRKKKDNAEQVVKGEHDHRMGWGDRT
jgi:hypothetical protein